MIRCCLAFALIGLGSPLSAQKLADLGWLEGSWEGPGIDGAPATEVYSGVAGGHIVGHFRQLKPDGSVMFYELVTIDEKDGQLRYRLKHFDRDLTGWETQAEVKEFILTSAIATQWIFSGLSYERTGRNRMTACVISRRPDGSEEKLEFRFRRKR